MKNTLQWLLVSAMLCGCQSLKYINGIESLPGSAVRGDHKLAIELLRPTDTSQLESSADSDLKAALRDCKTSYAAAAAPITGILLSSLGKFLFDAWVERERASLEHFKKMASPPTYSETVIVTPNLEQTRCVVITRTTVSRDAAGNESGTTLGLVAVLYGERYVGKDGVRAFVFTPRYVKANNSVAFVAKETPTLAIAIAFSLKGIAKHTTGMPSIVQISETVASVEGMAVGPQSAASCRAKPCPSSTFFGIPPLDAGSMALTVTVSERGSLPTSNMEIADLELKALKDSLGPGIRDALKEYLK